MYKHKFFESRSELLRWLNDNNIPKENIIEILPMPTDGNGYQREYELFYYEEGVIV
ncbi:MAG: hypothetical protein IJZ68_08770 [Bacteroidaceae bacterium]|nr:hypothetical protein [Bacteroidaceae bacterium]